MKILAVDIGTGTQDIFLFDSRLSLENGFRLVLPSPTMMIRRRITEMTARRSSILLTGRQMGGGPAAWAAEAHARSGLSVYATPDAARTLDDDLDRVASLGVTLVSEDEARGLPPGVERIRMGDFDFAAISDVFARFGETMGDLGALAVAVFDHGAAPPGESDRQFRFDYLDRRIRQRNALSSFAYAPSEVPKEMSRLQAVAQAAGQVGLPVVVMDTAPAAVLGATFDPIVGRRRSAMIVNIGNFHVLAFRLAGGAIEGLFEHHTGEITAHKLESYLIALAKGSLRHQDVFDDMGHGALVIAREPLLPDRDFDVVVTGPRRSMLRLDSNLSNGQATPRGRRLRPYFAVPFGDMMMSGCFGLLAAMAEVLPETAPVLQRAMRASSGPGAAPWDAM